MKRHISYLTSATMIATAFASVALPNAAAAAGLSPEFDQECDDLLRPASASVNDPEDDEKDTPFTIESTFVSFTTSTVENGEKKKIPGSEVGIESTLRVISGSAANVTTQGQLYRNGSSPNLHGLGQSTSAQYDDSSFKFNPGFTKTETTTYGCRVFKIVKGNGKVIEPAGLQVPGPARPALVDVQTTKFFTTEERTSPTGGGVVPITTPVPVEMVVCISPNSTTKGKAGSWVVKNGAGVSTDDCLARSNALGGASLPNLNAPTT